MGTLSPPTPAISWRRANCDLHINPYSIKFGYKYHQTRGLLCKSQFARLHEMVGVGGDSVPIRRTLFYSSITLFYHLFNLHTTIFNIVNIITMVSDLHFNGIYYANNI